MFLCVQRTVKDLHLISRLEAASKVPSLAFFEKHVMTSVAVSKVSFRVYSFFVAHDASASYRQCVDVFFLSILIFSFPAVASSHAEPQEYQIQMQSGDVFSKICGQHELKLFLDTKTYIFPFTALKV